MADLGATAPRLEVAAALIAEAESGEKYGKVSQVTLLFWTRIQRFISLLLVCACLFLAYQSGWYSRFPVRPVQRERPALGVAPVEEAAGGSRELGQASVGGGSAGKWGRGAGGAAAVAAAAAAAQAQPAHETVAEQRAAAAEAEAAAAASEPAHEAALPPSWEEAPANSCFGFFGHGYSTVYPLVGKLPPTAQAAGDAGAGAAAPGALSCRYHTALTATFCQASALVLHPDRIKVSQGGEALEAVMGRADEAELPVFSAGAAELIEEGLDALPVGGSAAAAAAAAAESSGQPLPNFKASTLASHLTADPFKLALLASLRTVSAADAAAPVCATRVREPVLALTRMEYVNLFHTSTDWYNVWSMARILGLEPVTGAEVDAMVATAKSGGLTPTTLVTSFFGAPKLPAHILFLDGHNEGAMDEGWLGLFISISYIKHFRPGAVCFDNIALAPFGYQSALSMGIVPKQRECRASPHVRQFGDDMVRGLALGPPRAASSCSEATPRTLFVRRVHYVVHPRHDGKVVRRLENEDAIWEALSAATGSGESSGVKVVNGVLSALPMRRQVALAQDACVIVGAHGAGLSHVLFAPPEVHVLEIQTPGFGRPHFIGYTLWAGSHHHLWALPTSSPDVHSVVSRVLEIAQHASVEGKEGSHGHGGGAGGGGQDHPGHNE